jgi:plastocyanin
MFRLMISIGFLLVLTMSMAACTGSTPAPAAQAEPVTYTIQMTEYAFSPAEIEVKVGQEVTLELVNLGQISHELMIGAQVASVNNRPSGFHMDLFETAHVEPMIMGVEEPEEGHTSDGHGSDHAGSFMVVLPENGDKASVTFTVTEEMVGEWELGCFEQDGVHYDAGMKGSLVVTR